MSRNYKFHNPEGLYFISFAVVGWLDVFTRNEYKDLFLESLQFCQKNKGLEVHAWCFMTNHIHLVFRSIKGQKPELLIGDLKRFTSQSIVKSIRKPTTRKDSCGSGEGYNIKLPTSLVPHPKIGCLKIKFK